MSGHSKWHNIKIRKQAQDKQKSKIFGKLSREIITAAREGGGDGDSNARLRAAVDKARQAGMPQDSIRRAIQRGTGEIEGVTYESAVYEGYGPSGVAILVELLTDNRNRVVSELRRVFTRNGGNLAESNAVAWLFNRKGVVLVPLEAASEEAVMETALEGGAEDLQTDETSYEIRTEPGALDDVKQALDTAGIPYESAEVTMVPQTRVTLGEKEAQQVLRLMDALEDLDDVQQVYANFDIPDQIMEAVAA
ncbi:MAG TPA: YebC/PmpR family DNA-binding transcriptional regulator [Armatimonadota bacterium]|nr:YebC/PmpR family DNA-binding transcriptional regulator [Armatimonadota bacterium]